MLICKCEITHLITWYMTLAIAMEKKIKGRLSFMESDW